MPCNVRVAVDKRLSASKCAGNRVAELDFLQAVEPEVNEFCDLPFLTMKEEPSLAQRTENPGNRTAFVPFLLRKTGWGC